MFQSSMYQKMLQPRGLSGAQTKTSPQSNALLPPKNGQVHRRPVEPPGSNTRVYLGFVCITLHLQRGVSWLFVRLVRFLVSPRLQKKGDRGKIALIAVEAVPAGRKPSTVVSVRISMGRRHGFGAAAPLSTRALSLLGRAGGSVESSPKLVRHIGGPVSTLFAEQLSPCFA